MNWWYVLVDNEFFYDCFVALSCFYKRFLAPTGTKTCFICHLTKPFQDTSYVSVLVISRPTLLCASLIHQHVIQMINFGRFWFNIKTITHRVDKVHSKVSFYFCFFLPSCILYLMSSHIECEEICWKILEFAKYQHSVGYCLFTIFHLLSTGQSYIFIWAWY